MNATTTPVKLFYSYAHEDEDLRRELERHLKILERRGLIAGWHDRVIVPGQDFDDEIHRNLLDAELILLLISVNFFNSDYICSQELRIAMAQQRSGRAELIHVHLRDIDLSQEDAEDFPFLKLVGLPPDLKPVESWPDRNEAWTQVAKGIRAAVKRIQGRRSVAPTAASKATGTEHFDQADDLAREKAATVQPAADDELLHQVVAQSLDFAHTAARVRGERAIDAAKVGAQAARLIDHPDQKRVLWVDDRPQNNRSEMAFFRSLQVEIVPVTSTDSALAALQSDLEGFDLIISDWDREDEAPSAGLRLAASVHKLHPAMPFVCYHGTFDLEKRRTRAESLAAAGALGEAVYPSELIDLVMQALGLDHV